MTTKGRLLYWGDAPTISTGFGVVARHVLGALFDAGYEVDCLGLNAVADFPDRRRFPYSIVPASMPPQDPFGYRILTRQVASGRYDVLLAQQDLHVSHQVGGYLQALRERGTRMPGIVYYYPIDCSVRRDLGGMLQAADVIVTCTAFGRQETEKALGGRSPVVIPHGVDTQVFRPLEGRAEVRRRLRQGLKLPDDALVICSVAANSIRKDLARAIAAFGRWRRAQARPAALYLHTMPVDNGLDLHQAVAASGLVVGRDVIFPASYHPLSGLPDQAMNELYNACDVYFTTTLGEGWGLPITEAMAAGLPVVAPRNSSLQELGGGGRAALYECRERVWVDNSGYRPLGLMDDIVAALAQAVEMPEIERRRMIGAARDFALAHDWRQVAPRWVPLCDALVAARRDAAAGAAGQRSSGTSS